MWLAVLRLVAPAAVVVAVWAHGYWQGSSTYRERAKSAQAAAIAEARRQAAAVEALEAQVAAAGQARVVVRERLVEVARDVVREVPADCRLPAGLRRLWHLAPGDLAPARSASGPDGAVPVVAVDGGRG